MMKNLRFIVVAAGLLSLAAMSVQAAPINGIYKSTELGGGTGTLIDGRWSEAYADGREGVIGSTINAASWNGATLGTMWELTGPAIDSTPTLRSRTVESNLTVEKWYTTYSGGTLKLKDTGAWWNAGDPGTQYTVTISSYSHDTTKYYSGSTLVDFATNIHLTGTFDDFPGSTVNFILAVGMPVQFGAPAPVDYPPFAINTTAGAWGVVQKIRMDIVPEPATLAILGLGGLLLRRRIA